MMEKKTYPAKRLLVSGLSKIDHEMTCGHGQVNGYMVGVLLMCDHFFPADDENILSK